VKSTAGAEGPGLHLTLPSGALAVCRLPAGTGAADKGAAEAGASEAGAPVVPG
jgi:hypothetical protein